MVGVAARDAIGEHLVPDAILSHRAGGRRLARPHTDGQALASGSRRPGTKGQWIRCSYCVPAAVRSDLIGHATRGVNHKRRRSMAPKRRDGLDAPALVEICIGLEINGNRPNSDLARDGSQRRRRPPAVGATMTNMDCMDCETAASAVFFYRRPVRRGPRT
jgi:hypothetical protein